MTAVMRGFPLILFIKWYTALDFQVQLNESSLGKYGVLMKLQVGDRAPDFELMSHLKSKVRLSSLRGQTVVLAFFPKAWTPV